MESVNVPLRSGGKKMRKRRELDALVAHSLAKRACNSGKRQAGNGINSQDQLLSQSTDDQEDYSSWSKVRIAARHRKNVSLFRTCVPLLFITLTFIMFSIMYWLYFDLREQLSDHRTKIQQVSEMSLNVPDAFQKWHESSKSLEQNQTALNIRLTDLQSKIILLENEIIDLKSSIKKKEEATTNDQSVNLKDTVAGFGAKIEALRIDVDSLKENYHDVQKNQNDDKVNMDKLKMSIDQMVNTSASISMGAITNQTAIFYQNLTDRCINNVTAQLTVANDTILQRIKVLDDQLHEHNVKIDGLSESLANVSSHVTSIENEWPKFKSDNAQMDMDIAIVKNDTLLLKSMLNDKWSNNNVEIPNPSESIKNNDTPDALNHKLFDLPNHSIHNNSDVYTIKTVTTSPSTPSMT